MWAEFTIPRAIRLYLLISACALPASPLQSAEPTAPADPLKTSPLIYVSDYVSFVGADEQGRVAFALDTNRGRDGAKYQAEHLVILHDERTGWVQTVGSGAYPNFQRDLAHLRDSPFFHFDGTPESGLTITSEKSDLALRIKPLPHRMQQDYDSALTWMGSGPAELTWHGRTSAGA